MNVIPYIFYPLSLGLIFFTYAFFKWPKYAIAGLIIAKPIIDLTRYYYILLNINFLKIYAGLFVILGVVYILYHRPKILRHPLSIIWLIFLGLNFVSIFVISEPYLLLNKIDYFLRILTGFVALVLFAYLFDYKKDKRFILSIFIIAGIFPLLLWLIPVLSGNPIISNDPLRRIIGPYHGFKVFMYVATQTLICCLAYLSLKGSSFSYLFKRIASKLRLIPASRLHNFPPSQPQNLSSSNPQNFLPSKLHSIIKSPFLRLSVSLKGIFVLFMFFVSIAMIYKCYSKAGWITLATILLIWFLLRKKYILASIVPVISAIIIFINPFAKDFQKTFQNEIDYFIHGSNTKEMVFRGRLSRWERGMDDFNSLPVINKLFGAKKSIGNPENAYVRVLWDVGVIGFVVFVTLLGLTCYLIISKYMRNKTPILLMSILIFVMFLVNSIGEYPMFFPGLQWFMWGTTGFILSNNKTAVGTKN